MSLTPPRNKRRRLTLARSASLRMTLLVAGGIILLSLGAMALQEGAGEHLLFH